MGSVRGAENVGGIVKVECEAPAPLVSSLNNTFEQGHDVLHPMGWDSFGLPAEQHAIATGTHPRQTMRRNAATFKRQLKMLGFSYDWEREVSTTDEGYMKWTQWIFLQLYKAGLAKQSEASVNWCPALGTVLANEEVIDGKSERGDHPVIRQPLRQWVLCITKYADKLEKCLKGLNWPEGTLVAQNQWIGRSEGASIIFGLDDIQDHHIEVFTTRPDTVMGVTYLVLAPEHPLVERLTTPQQCEAVEKYKILTLSRSDLDRKIVSDKEKTAVSLGTFASHPLSGQKIPIWISDYVKVCYGTGAVMGVPAHDERDMVFAKTFDLPIKRVIVAKEKFESKFELEKEGEIPCYTGEGICVNSGASFDGLTTANCKAAILSTLNAIGKGKPHVTYKLRDWIFSRQRYWGEPIPIYYPVEMKQEGDPRKGAEHIVRYDYPIPCNDSELPILLPEMDSFEPGDDPAGALSSAVEWRFFFRDGQWFARETNTMPQWAGSCWYYLRFTDPVNDYEPWGKQADADWMPVDLYVGGQEHAVLHLLYARFWHKVLFDLGYVKDSEPFQKLIHQGMILGPDGEKMSKSRGNVLSPDDVVNHYGADALRLYELFMGPLEAKKPWQMSQVSGVVRFRDRIQSIALRTADKSSSPTFSQMDSSTIGLLHKTIMKVTQDIEGLTFNTAISALMVLSNHIAGLDPPPREAVKNLILLVHPFAPHLAEECWELIGEAQPLSSIPWIEWDETLCEDEMVTIGVQVNGKLRGEVSLAKNADEEEVRIRALSLEKVSALSEGKTIRKFIYIPGKIVNVVVK